MFKMDYLIRMPYIVIDKLFLFKYEKDKINDYF